MRCWAQGFLGRENWGVERSRPLGSPGLQEHRPLGFPLGTQQHSEGPAQERSPCLARQHSRAVTPPERIQSPKGRPHQKALSSMMPTCLVLSALLPSSPRDDSRRPRVRAGTEEGTASEEGEDLPGEQQAESSEEVGVWPPLSSVCACPVGNGRPGAH